LYSGLSKALNGKKVSLLSKTAHRNSLGESKPGHVFWRMISMVGSEL
jgi:hypothetical protein